MTFVKRKWVGDTPKQSFLSCTCVFRLAGGVLVYFDLNLFRLWRVGSILTKHKEEWKISVIQKCSCFGKSYTKSSLARKKERKLNENRKHKKLYKVEK